jgi:hypothetical protein
MPVLQLLPIFREPEYRDEIGVSLRHMRLKSLFNSHSGKREPVPESARSSGLVREANKIAYKCAEWEIVRMSD